MKLRQLLLSALFAAIMCISILWRFPIPPTGIMFTLQTLVVFLTGLLLKPKYALISMLVYTALGLVGLPVFSQGGGIGYPLAQPSFGFIIGFSVCALLISLLVRKNLVSLIKKNTDEPKLNLILKVIGFSLVSILALYICGITYMYIWFTKNLENAATLGVLISQMGIYVAFDSIKFAIAMPLSVGILKRLPAKFSS